MEQVTAKAYCEFVLQSKKVFDQIFDKEIVDNEELKALKETFDIDRLNDAKCDFEKELMQNYLEYKDEELIFEYIRMNLEPIKTIKFKQTKSDILRNGWEVNYLIFMKKCIEFHISFITYLMVSEMLYDIDNEEDMVYYTNLTKYCEKLLAFSKGEDIDAVPTEKERIEYEKVNSFNFAVLLCECDELKILTERIKLITARLYEFEQWKIEHEKIDDVSGSYVTDYHKLLYPNFEKLCKVEIEKLEKLIKLENDLPYNVLPEKIASEIVDKSGNSDYIWKSSATDLLELAAALYQNKSVERRDGKDMTRKELVNYFQNIFDKEITDMEGKLSKASDRNNNTAFLDNLSQQFRNYVAGKEAKMMKRR